MNVLVGSCLSEPKKSISPAFAFGIFDPIFVSWIFPTSSEGNLMFLKTRNDFLFQGAKQLELSLKLIKVSRSIRFSISSEYFRNTKSADCEERREGETVSPLGAILTSSTPTPHQQPTVFLVGTSTSTPCHTSKLSFSNWPNSLSSDTNVRRKNVGECKLEIGKDCFEESLSDFVNSVLFVDSATLSPKLCYYSLYYRSRTQKKRFSARHWKGSIWWQSENNWKGTENMFQFRSWKLPTRQRYDEKRKDKSSNVHFRRNWIFPSDSASEHKMSPVISVI